MEKRRVPLGLRRRELPPGSLVHKSVVVRMKDGNLKYKPKNVLRTELAPATDDSAPILVDGKYYLFSLATEIRAANCSRSSIATSSHGVLVCSMRSS